MWVGTLIKQYLMISRDMIIFPCPKKVEHSLGYSGGGWYFLYKTLPFGWKISPYVYHSTGLITSSNQLASPAHFNDRHNGQLQVPSMHGAYAVPITQDAFNLAVANSAIFLVAYHLITLAYFLGPGKINPDTIQGSPISGLFARFLPHCFSSDTRED